MVQWCGLGQGSLEVNSYCYIDFLVLMPFFDEIEKY